MFQFDENGNPIWPPKVPHEELFNAAPAPAAPAARANSMNPMLASAGINTEGPIADRAAETAANYRESSVNGQYMPQQFGTAETEPRDEGPLSPQAVAERMPQTADAMQKLINQHILRGPKPPTVSGNGQQNSVTAKREADESERASRELRAQSNRAATREKTADAWDQTVRLNALQGAGPMGGNVNYGGGQNYSSGGPKVQRIGGYAFVSGSWRPADSMEQAKLNQMDATTEYTRARPGIEQQENLSRERIAGAGLQARSAENEANRKLQQQRIDETARHHGVLEGAAAETRQTKQDEKTDKLIASLMPEMEAVYGDLLELDSFAQEDERGFWGRPLIPYLDGWKPPERGSKEFMERADQIPVRDRQGNPTGKREPKPGAYKTLQRRLMKVVERIVENTPEGMEPNIPPEIKEYLRPLFNERDMQNVPMKR